MKLAVMILTVAGMILSSSVFAATIRVPSEQPTIQAGIEAAVNGDTVLVADGTYTGDGNRDIDFNGKAITVASENGAETCIIDCQGSEKENHRGFYFHTNEPETAIVQGFTVQNGFNKIGGGIYYDSSSSTISNCTFTKNTAKVGGGIYFYNSPNSIISNCVFSGNAAEEVGSGIFCYQSDTKISNCTFTENSANRGGGIFFCYSTNSTISNCTLTENISQDGGGGIYFFNSPDSIISNCTFCENTATWDGGGIYIGEFSSASISNCIFWNDTPSEIYFEEYIPTIAYSLIQGGYPGIGNIDADPMFLGGDPFDFHLSSNSPCIDAGTDRNAPTTDLEGNPRPQGGAVDMGAYEYQGWPSLTRAYITMPTHTFISGDTVSCSVSVWNADTSILKEYPLFVMLDVFGSYYYAPSFSEFDHYDWTFFPGLTELTVLPEFTWPENVGSASGIVWYAALVNPEMTELVSEIGVFDFGWSE